MEHEEGLLRFALPLEHDPVRRGEPLPGGARGVEQADDGLHAERGQLLHGSRNIRIHRDGECEAVQQDYQTGPKLPLSSC